MNELSNGFLERGVVKEIENGGYRIESKDRPGIVTPPIHPLHLPRWADHCNCEECDRPCQNADLYEEGDRVIYWLFADGTGVIVGKW